jgi:hypothetical protein
MTSIWQPRSSASDSLHTAGLFEFSQGRSVILATLGDPAGPDAERGFDILQLTSAEFSLLPVYLMPQTLRLPLTEPISVPGWAALASIVKGSCSLANPYHYDQINLVTFTGDAQKLQVTDNGVRYLSASDDQPDWNNLVEQLENQYREAGTPMGEALVASGVLRLQALLWAAKWMTIVPGTDLDFAKLARSMGVVS